MAPFLARAGGGKTYALNQPIAERGLRKIPAPQDTPSASIPRRHGATSLPKNIRELAAYFAGPCDEAALARYEITATGRMRDVPENTPVLEEQMSPSEREDSEISSINGLPVRLKTPGTSTPESRAQEKRSRTIWPAIEKYQESHGGDWPTDTQQLRPYVTDPSVLDGIKMIENGFSYETPQ